MIGQTVSHYRILEELGGGGMGVVYKAEDARLGRLVALKFLSEELSRDSEGIKRFQREARAASALNHPNICTIHDIDEHEGRQFIVMELMEGKPLKDHIEGKPLAAEEIVALAAQICEGLQAAHQRGIIHRDLKPANLFVTQSGQVKVLDFGVAKLLPQEEDTTITGTETVGGRVLGTLAYMAPEQLNRQKVDARTDIYALGCVLYEMATGQRPFAKEFGAQRIASILSRLPEPPSQLNPAVPAWLDAIILKCLEKEPERRYGSAKELLADLRQQATPTAALTPTPSPEAPVQPSGFPVPSGVEGRRWSMEKLLRSAQRPLPLGISLAVVAVALLLGFNVGGWRTRLVRSLGTGPPKIDSLAVLPLENLSGDPEQEYFADGMTDELIGQLAQIGALRVISRTSVMQYKEARKPLPQIARELNVDAVLEGTVQRAGERVRIRAQLLLARTDTHLWSGTYERDIRDILALQSEVARTIAREIKIKLTPQEQARLSRHRRVNPEALELYLKGRFAWNKRSPAGLMKSIELYQQALEQDPDNPLTWAGLADSYNQLGYRGHAAPGEVYPRAKAAALKALEGDATLAEAEAALGFALFNYEWNWREAESALRRAIELNPNYGEAHHWLSHYLMDTGRVEESLEESERAIEIDPLSLIMSVHLGWNLVFARKYELAVEHARTTVDIDPNFYPAYLQLGRAYRSNGDYAEAIAAERKAVTLSDSGPEALAALGVAYGQAGKRDEAAAILKQLQQRGTRQYVSAFDIATVYAALGDRNRALEQLEKSFQERASRLIEIKVDPLFDPLRTDHRFQALVRRMNFPG